MRRSLTPHSNCFSFFPVNRWVSSWQHDIGRIARSLAVSLPFSFLRFRPSIRPSVRPHGEIRYVVVAVEQTSQSVPLQEFTFPKKVVLLIGNEQEGLNADILSHHVDRTVEIPQLGIMRCLNAHVSAACCLWQIVSNGQEEIKQNLIMNAQK